MTMDKAKLKSIYAEYLDLIEHLVAKFTEEWPNRELFAHVKHDEVMVSWRLGHVGRITREGAQICFASDARRELRELDAGMDGLEFEHVLRSIEGWRDEAKRSDIEYQFRNFWDEALEEAKLNWEGMTATTDLLDKMSESE